MYVVKILRTIIPLNESGTRQSNSSFNQRIIAQKWLSGVLTHYDTIENSSTIPFKRYETIDDLFLYNILF